MSFLDSLFSRKPDSIKEVEQRLKAEQNAPTDTGSGCAVKIFDIYNITGIGVVPVGEVIEGTLKPGYICQVAGKQGEVKTIEMHHQEVKQATIGDKIGFNLKGVNAQDIKKGDILRFRQK